MEANPLYIGVSVQRDVSQAMWSIAVHGVAAVMVFQIFGELSPVSVLSAILVLLFGCTRWSALLHWPQRTAISRVVVTRSGQWFLTDPAGFVHAARLVAWHAHGVSSLEMEFRDNEWQVRRVRLDDRNSDQDERLRLSLHLEYLAALHGVNRPVPFWLHL